MLTSDQVKVVSITSYRAEVELTPGQDGPLYFLRTPSGSVPIWWIEDYLKDCGVTYLRAIRTYADGTPGRLFAQIFSDWCVGMGLAVPATGPNPAAWINEQAKSKCKTMIGLDEQG
jgi:hypothetical protein